ncbi:MAG: hypothetical protein ACRC8S_19880 [Fimbriiglobus sp.]
MTDPRFQPTGPEDPLCLGDSLARALSKLAPAPVSMLTSDMMFEAGRADESRRTAFWKRLAGAQVGVMAIGVAVVVALWQQPKPSVSTPPTIATVSVAKSEPLELAPEPREYEPPTTGPSAGFASRTRLDEPSLEERVKWFQLQNDILAGGVSMLPTPPRETRLPTVGGNFFAIPKIGPRPAPPEETYP